MTISHVMAASHIVTCGLQRQICMYTAKRKEQEKEERRITIISAAERLFSSRGYDNVTVEDVAREARLAKGTLYLYFKNKEALYVAVVIRGMAVMGEMMDRAMAAEKKGISKTYAGGLAYYEFAKQHPVYFGMMLDAQQRYFAGTMGEAIRAELALNRSRIQQITIDAVRTGITDGTIRPDAEPRKTALLLIETITAMIRASLEAQAIKDGSPAARDEIVYFTLDMLRHSIEKKSTPVKGV